MRHNGFTGRDGRRGIEGIGIMTKARIQQALTETIVMHDKLYAREMNCPERLRSAEMLALCEKYRTHITKLTAMLDALPA